MNYTIAFLVLLLVAGAVLAYVVGQKARYKYCMLSSKKRRYSVIVYYNALHVIVLAVFSVFVMYVTIEMLSSYDFSWTATTQSNKPLADVLTRMFIAMIIIGIEWLIISKLFFVGNARTRKIRMPMDLNNTLFKEIRSKSYVESVSLGFSKKI